MECGCKGLGTNSTVGAHITLVVMRKENYVESKNVINLTSGECCQSVTKSREPSIRPTPAVPPACSWRGPSVPAWPSGELCAQ